MNNELNTSDSLKESLNTIWSEKSDEIAKIAELDEDCGPTKTCKNMKEISFEGFATSGGSLSDAWKATLAREGKLNEGNESIKNIVFGNKDNK